MPTGLFYPMAWAALFPIQGNVKLGLKGNEYTSMFSAIFTMGDYSCVFLFDSLDEEAVSQRVYPNVLKYWDT